jgi:hypothetical protein
MSAWMLLMPHPGACSDSDENAAMGQSSSPAASVNRTRPPLQKAPAMKIYIDPKTKNFSDPPPAQQLPTESQKAFEPSQASALELRPASSPRPGGGVMIDLKGRFRSPLTATRKADGKLAIEHPHPAAPSEKQ